MTPPLPRAIPRPSVFVVSPVTRTWKQCVTSTLRIGDVVADHGRVVHVFHGVTVAVVFSSGKTITSDQVPGVYAFTEAL